MNKLQFLKELESRDEIYGKLANTLISILERELEVDLINADFRGLSGFFDVVNIHVQSNHLGFMQILKDGGVDGVLTDTVYENYLQYTDDKGWRNVMSKTKFSRMLRKNFGYETKLQHIPELGKTQRVYVYVGIDKEE